MRKIRLVLFLFTLTSITGCSYPSSEIAYDKLGAGKLVNRLKINDDWNCDSPEVVSKPKAVIDCAGLKEYELFSVYKNNIYHENMETIHSKLLKIFGSRTLSIESFIEKGKLYAFDCSRQGDTAICKYHGEFGIRFVQGPFSLFKPPMGGKFIFDFLVKGSLQKETEVEISGFSYPIDGENSGIVKLY